MSGHVSLNCIPDITSFEGIFHILVFLPVVLGSFTDSLEHWLEGTAGPASSTEQGCQAHQVSSGMAFVLQSPQELQGQ